jgi:hypothetical protein
MGLDITNISGILRNQEIPKLVSPYFETHILSYKWSRKRAADKDIGQNCHKAYSCNNSKCINQHCGHVVTGDLTKRLNVFYKQDKYTDLLLQ